MSNVVLFMKNTDAACDDIPAYVTKIYIIIDVYIKPLTHMIDKSFNESVFLFNYKWFLFTNLVIRVK